MKAGKLDRRIVIQSKSENVSVYGFRTSSWGTFKSVWANVVHDTGKEQTDNKNRSTERTVKFRTRYFSSVTNTMRIVWNGDVYKIEDIKELGREDGLLIITSKLTQT